METHNYQTYLELKDLEFESICRKCGECCGSKDEPCRNLSRQDNGTYLCRDYTNRIGPQETISGNFFYCVSIREHIKDKTLRPNCAYHRI